MALETDNIEGEVERMEGCGVQFLGQIRPGSAGTKGYFHSSKITSWCFGRTLCSSKRVIFRNNSKSILILFLVLIFLYYFLN